MFKQGTLIRIFSTLNCAKTGELRRGVDHATIYSISISPDNTRLAVTSDKSTLHIFDLPHHERTFGSKSPQSASRSSTAKPDEISSQKWGILGRIPMLPRFFSDVYSFASARIESEEIPENHFTGTATSKSIAPVPVVPERRPLKGIIGWLNNHTILVISAGRDGRWEKFIVGEAEDGRRHCIRQGWKRYLGD